MEDQSWELKVCEKVSSQAARQQPSVKNAVSCCVGLSIALLNINILEVFSFCSAWDQKAGATGKAKLSLCTFLLCRAPRLLEKLLSEQGRTIC